MDGTVFRTPRELLGRFTPTPWRAELCVAGRIVRLETNSKEILRRTVQVLGGRHSAHASGTPLRWRIVLDSEAALRPPWPPMTAFTGLGLHCVNIGQRSFLALDPDERVAVAFLAAGLTRDETGFRTCFLKRLVEMTANVLAIQNSNPLGDGEAFL